MQIWRLFTWLLAVAVVLALGTRQGWVRRDYWKATTSPWATRSAYGIQPGKGGGPPTFDNGYVDLFAARLQAVAEARARQLRVSVDPTVGVRPRRLRMAPRRSSCTIRFAVHSSRRHCRSCGLTKDRSAR